MPEIYVNRFRRVSRAVFLSIFGVVAVALLISAREILLPFILAIVVAYVLTPAVFWAEKARVPRWGAVLIVYALSIGGLYASIASIAPRLAFEMRSLAHEAPALAGTVRDQYMPAIRNRLSAITGSAPEPEPEPVEPAPSAAVRVVPRADGSYDLDLGPGVEIQELGGGRWRLLESSPEQNRPFQLGQMVGDAVERAVAYIQHNTLEAIRFGQLIITAISRAIFVFFMTLMLAAYIMITRERIIAFFRSLVYPDARWSFDVLLARVDRGLSGVVRGQLLICVVNGVLSAIGFWIFGLKYWPILSIVAAVMSLVPIFGSILSSVPIVAIALTQSFGTALTVLGWILLIHQIEANVLNPKIIGDAAKIHPVLVVFSLLVGEHFFGLPGALLAVPVLSITQSCFLHFQQITFGEDAPADSFIPPPPRYSTPPPPAVVSRPAAASERPPAGLPPTGTSEPFDRSGP
jgi:predicted PurR-regulated permease PerM